MLVPIEDFELNGVTVDTIEPLPSMGPLASHVIHLTGTATNKNDGLPYNEPTRLYKISDAMLMLDTTGDRAGTLPYVVRYLMEFVKCVVYVTVVEEGLDAAATEANVVGGTDVDTGAVTGLQTIKACPETPTIVAAPGFSSKPVGQSLALIGRDIRCRPVLDGPNTNDMAAAEFAGEFGAEGTGEDKLAIIDPWFLKTYDGVQLLMPASIALVAAMASVEGYESPQNIGVSCDETSRNVSYKINDSTTQANFLNKYGVVTIARTRMGGYSIIGNRTNTGRFISHVGLEDLMARKLEETSQPLMGKQLTEDFMNQVIDRLTNWGQNLVAQGVIPVFKAFLHPSKNNLENYTSGRWYLCVNYGRYSPNEHMVYEMSVDNGLIEAWLEEVVNG
ncbi:phage tail protein [Vibrio plantisponsor]|uniref:Phage tail protein n=1 Tax=Vibrio plantisponsor TaxID=664643 RepID=A0ABU4IEX7_9VIBR|nr:phage tail protein [Vibrio plantisponsor]MDW6016779.1 phage tail protein [Vibrio plantisponsor]NNM39850.1 phage tail protein [Vibrio plantisponsor]